MSNLVAGLDVQMRLDQVLAELKKLSPTMDAEAKQMVAALSRQVKQAEAALKKSAQDATQTKNALKSAAEGAGAFGSGIQRLAGAASMAGGPIGELFRNVADLADVAEVGAGAGVALEASLASVLAVAGPLALAVGAGAIAYSVYSEQVEAAKVSLDREREATEQNLAISKKVVEAELKLANLKGQISDKDYARLSAAQTADEVFAARKASLIDRLNEENTALQANEAVLKSQAAMTDAATKSANLAWAQAAAGPGVAKAATETATAGVEQHKAAIAALSTQLGDLVVAEQGYASTLTEIKNREDSVTDSTDRMRIALAVSQEHLDGAIERWRDYRSALEAIRGAGEAAKVAQLDEIGKINAARDAALQKLDENTAKASLAAIGHAEAQAKVEAEAADARVAINAQADAEIDKAHAEIARRESDRQKKLQQERLGQLNDLGGYVQQGLGLLAASFESSYQATAEVASRLETQLAASEEFLTDAQKKNLERRIEAAKDAAEKQFEAAKHAKSAEAVMSTALAAINAIAQSPPPSPFGLAGAAIATGLGVAAVAQIESQQFTAYTGGLPDEVPATLHRKEAVLSQQGRSVLGDETINKLNAGIALNNEPAEIRFVYGHREFDMAITSTVRRGGRLQRTISGRKTPSGHGARR